MEAREPTLWLKNHVRDPENLTEMAYKWAFYLFCFSGRLEWSRLIMG